LATKGCQGLMKKKLTLKAEKKANGYTKKRSSKQSTSKGKDNKAQAKLRNTGGEKKKDGDKDLTPGKRKLRACTGVLRGVG